MKIKDLDKVIVNFKQKKVTFIDKQGNKEVEKLEDIHLTLIDLLIIRGYLSLDNVITK